MASRKILPGCTSFRLFVTSLCRPHPPCSGMAWHASSVRPMRREVTKIRSRRTGVLVAQGLKYPIYWSQISNPLKVKADPDSPLTKVNLFIVFGYSRNTTRPICWQACEVDCVIGRAFNTLLLLRRTSLYDTYWKRQPGALTLVPPRTGVPSRFL